MGMNSITIRLSDAVYQRARRAATLLNRSVEDLLETTIDTTLRSLEDAPPSLEADLAGLPLLTDAELWQMARSRMDAKDEKLLHELLDTQTERQLTTDETRQVETLRHEAGRLTLIISQAYSLLHQRGFPVPRP